MTVAASWGASAATQADVDGRWKLFSDATDPPFALQFNVGQFSPDGEVALNPGQGSAQQGVHEHRRHAPGRNAVDELIAPDGLTRLEHRRRGYGESVHL